MKNISIIRENRIAILTIKRLETLNSLNKALLLELDQLIDKLETEKNLSVVIITGEGRSFVAGADLEEMSKMNPVTAKEFAKLGQSLFAKIESSRLVFIAALNGYVLGGGNELSLACDLRLAARSARFAQPELGLGLITGFGGSQRLRQIVGMARAKELLFTGKTIKVEEALEIGLVNQVFETEELLEKARELALLIAQNSTQALEKIKSAINYGLENGLQEGYKRETELFASCFLSGEAKERIEIFLESKGGK